MTWNTVRLQALLAAMALCDHLGRDAFRIRYAKFRPANNLHVRLNGGNCDEARPLLAGAFANLHPNGPYLAPRDFDRNDAHDFLVARFGFETIPI